VMGIAVFSGMLGVTFFGLFFTPIFYVLLRKLEGNRSYYIPEKTEFSPAVPAPTGAHI
jgi:multidrug efflux pump